MRRSFRFLYDCSWTQKGWYFALRALCYGLLAYLVVPILAIIPLSFKDGQVLIYPIHRFTLHWYYLLFSSDTWMRAIHNSFIIAPSAMVLATTLGTLCALGMNRTSFFGKKLLTALMLAPIVTPVVVVGLAMYLFDLRYGFAGTYIGIIIAHAVLGAPLVLITVSATLQGLDPSLPEASLGLGAGHVETFFRITLPLILPGILSGALFAFTTSFDEVIVTLFLASPVQTTIPVEMYTGLRNSISPTIVALATLLIIFTTCMMFFIQLLRYVLGSSNIGAITVRVD